MSRLFFDSDLVGADGRNLSGMYGVIAIANANVDSGQSGLDVGWGVPVTTTGQIHWRWCQNCQGLAYWNPSAPGRCPAGAYHDYSASSDYVLAHDRTILNAQNQWRWCKKCQGLTYAGNQGAPLPCPAGGSHDLTQSYDYVLAHDTTATNGQDQWRWCTNCQGLAYAGNPGVLGPCPAKGNHDHTGSANYVITRTTTLACGFAAHETGHTFGLDHSFDTSGVVHDPVDDGRPGAYGDWADIMSAAGDSNDFDYPSAGPGLNAPTLYKLGWMNEAWIWTYNSAQSTSAVITLGALTGPQGTGKLPSGVQYLMGKVVRPDRVYTVEVRQPVGWDKGLSKKSSGHPGVLVHELRSLYTAGQDLWRWCKNCQGLVYAGNAICPAGGAHSQSGSGNYVLDHNTTITNGQDQWRWCKNCQGLFYAGNPGALGPCPAGGNHDGSGSADYVLVHDATITNGQDQWRWCRNCQGLWYNGSMGWGTCPSGDGHTNAGSATYSLLLAASGPGQTKWRWCSKCLGLWYAGFGARAVAGTHDFSDSRNYSLVDNVPSAPGQPQWKWCWKCGVLAFSGNPTSGACAAGNGHDFSHSTNYTLAHDGDFPNMLGQQGWKWCQKCQALAFWDGSRPPGKCPADGLQHNHSVSYNYGLANFGGPGDSDGDLTFLATYNGFLQQNGAYTNESGTVKISVTAINDAAGTATVKIVVSP